MSLPDEVEIRVIERAEYVEEAVSILLEKQALSEDAYLADRSERAIVEREFHTAIEACIDIAGLLIGTTDREMPDRYSGRFTVLEEQGVLSSTTTSQMRRAAGFRNVLAHRYGSDIDDKQVYEHLQHDLDVLVAFLDEVRQFLDIDES